MALASRPIAWGEPPRKSRRQGALGAQGEPTDAGEQAMIELMALRRLGSTMGALLLAGWLTACGTDSHDSASGGAPPAATGGSSGSAGRETSGAGTSAGGTAPADPESAFADAVVMTRVGALGYCIQDGQLASGRIEEDEAKAVVFSGAIHLGWDPASPGCSASRCQLTEEVGPLPLTREELVSLAELISVLPSGECYAASPACDPCLITVIQVDGARYWDDPCGGDRCTGYVQGVQALRDFVDGLASRARGLDD